jgi:hypothetical protein
MDRRDHQHVGSVEEASPNSREMASLWKIGAALRPSVWLEKY